MTADRQMIGGRWRDAVDGGTWDLINPATEQVITTLPFGGGADASAAIDAAHAAGEGWAALGPFARGEVLDRAAALIADHAEEWAAITTEESGKPLAQALGEWRSAPGYLRFAAAEARRSTGRVIPSRVPGQHIDVTHRPVGVVGLITAWNFPVYNVVRALSSALAAGCTVVVRPSEHTPRSAMRLVWALHEAGAPAGVVNLVNGDPVAMGQVMLEDPRCRKIAFTGSTRVGRLLMQGAARTITGLSLELGGNAPAIVHDDVDVEFVARAAVAAKLRNGGQVCVAPQRFYVHRRICERFLDAATAAMDQQVLGDGAEAATTVGPLINASQRARVEGMVAAATAGGATLVRGGSRPAGRSAGFFHEPTLLTDVAPGMAVHDEEIFGPVMPVITFDDGDDVVGAANAVEQGLAAYVFTRDLDRAMATSAALQAGMVGVNSWAVAAAETPFGGHKQSGIGSESGTEGLHEYLDVTTRFIGGC